MPHDNNLEFRPGSVVPLSNDREGWTFTVCDQFDRTWNAEKSMGTHFVFDKAYEAKSAMRRFCQVGDID